MLGMRLTGRLGGAHAENIEDEENVKVKMNKIEVKTNKCGSLCIFFKEQAFTDEPCKLLHVPVVGLMELKVADACVSAVQRLHCLCFVNHGRGTQCSDSLLSFLRAPEKLCFLLIHSHVNRAWSPARGMNAQESSSRR